MTVKEYLNTDDNRKVNKNLTFIATHDCILYNSTSITTPVLKFKHIPTGNYIYIPYFNRYYFITDVVTDNGSCYVSCKCDVLYTYRDSIYGTDQFITRCESLRDNMLTDTAFNMSVDTVLYTRSFGNEIVTNHLTYILGVI